MQVYFVHILYRPSDSRIETLCLQIPIVVGQTGGNSCIVQKGREPLAIVQERLEATPGSIKAQPVYNHYRLFCPVC